MLPHVPYLHRDMSWIPWCVLLPWRCPLTRPPATLVCMSPEKKPQEHRVTAPNKSSGNGTRSGLGKKKKVSLSVGHSVSPCAQSDQTPLVGVSRGFAAWMMTPFWICQWRRCCTFWSTSIYLERTAPGILPYNHAVGILPFDCTKILWKWGTWFLPFWHTAIFHLGFWWRSGDDMQLSAFRTLRE